MKQSQFFFMALLFISFGLVGCGTPSSSTSSSAPTATQKLVTQDSNGSVEVLEYSSSPIEYDGEHGMGGRRGRHTDYLTTTITLDKNNIITAVSNVHQASSPKSQSYQSRFENAIQSYIVGKNIKDAKVSIVGGASTTSEAFNAALDSVRIQISR